MARKSSDRDDDASALGEVPDASSASVDTGPSLFGDALPEAPKPYVVLARKYRPRNFDDLIGQEAMVQTLSNAFASDRIAQAYMLTGVRGVGKTTTARILARALNFSREGSPDKPTIALPTDPKDYGRHCREILESRHPDVVEIDAASNTGVDNIRELIESARYRPISARIKVYIIDEVHMLSKGAFNALLKTLEEPPEHVKFIFATTEVRKVPVTVLSRCQRFDLRRIDVPLLVKHFQRITAAEGAEADDDALALIARAAEGSVRDGLSILDQAIASREPRASGTAELGAVTQAGVRAMLGLADRGRIFDLVELLLSGQAAQALAAYDQLHRDGADPVQVLEDLAEAVHTTTRAKVAGADGAGDALSGEERKRAAALAEKLSIPLLSRGWQMLLKGLDETARAPDQRASAEMVLIRVAHVADVPPPEEIIKLLGGRGTPRPAGTGAGTSQPRAPQAGPGQHLNAAPAADFAAAAAPSATGPVDEPPPHAHYPEDLTPVDVGDDLDADPVETPGEDEPATARMPDPRTFDEVVDLVGQKRDARLKVHLEDNTSLVKFDASAGAIDLFLLPRAPPEIANELREKLQRWTGRRWIVALSKAHGAPPLGEVRRQREAAELEALKQHPAVKAVLDTFPGARIASVKPLVRPEQDSDESAAG
jgi:DNA polymerase-3 subunit gamma/tau